MCKGQHSFLKIFYFILYVFVICVKDVLMLLEKKKEKFSGNTIAPALARHNHLWFAHLM